VGGYRGVVETFEKAVSASLMEGASLSGGSSMLSKYLAAAHMRICLGGWVGREAFDFPKSWSLSSHDAKASVWRMF